jgi:hypothetical protein
VITHLATSVRDHATLVGVLEFFDRIDVFDVPFGAGHASGHTASSLMM